MPLLYFDNNIISYLHHPERYAAENWHSGLSVIKDYLNNPGNAAKVLYSPAHLMDVRRGFAKDKEQALAKLKFLSELTRDSCIVKDIFSNDVQFEQRDATVFFSKNSDNPEDFLAPGEHGINLLAIVEDSHLFDKHKDKRLNYSAVAEAFAPLEMNLQRTKENPTVYSMMCDFAEYYQDLFTSGHKIYKIVRDKARAETGVAEKIAGQENPLALLEQLFQETDLGRRINDVMIESFRLDPKNREDIVASLFMNLDLLGFEKDKLSERHGYMSVATDASHCFYASYCDIFVTQDSKTAAKSRAVYKYLKIDTEVFDVKQLEKWINLS